MGGATFPLLQLVAELQRNQRVRSDVSIQKAPLAAASVHI